mmetsp:Transcript_21807/g.40599  ORF Transcript_21807/g.40599 Transcript_21807/m.40599 type:complete len:579 (+) Transcript_21807:48-1784(+)
MHGDGYKCITRTFNVHHNVVSWIEVELLVCTATEKVCVPGCRVEVKAYDEEIGELASCQGVCRLGHPIAKVNWLGRSSARPAHESVRGLPCIDVEGSELKRSVAQVVFGLFAGIAIRLGATALDLVADDDGSGRLVKYYSRLGFEKGVQVEGAVWNMRGPIAVIAELAPPSWLEGLMPPTFDALKWFCSFMKASSESQVSVKKGLAGSMPALRSISVGTGRQGLLVGMIKQHHRSNEQRQGIVGKRSRPTSASKARSPPVLESTADGHTNKSMPSLGSTAPAAWQPSTSRQSQPLSAAFARNAVAPESTVGIAGATCGWGRQPGLAGMRKRPISAARVCEALPTLPSLPRVQSLTFLQESMATKPVSGQWRWNAEWPADATVDATLTQSKSSKHLRVDVWLHGSCGAELAYVRGAIPPNKRFLRVLWLGCTHSQPVHTSVRSRPAYFICSDSEGPQVRVTAAVALLGVLAKIACWLDIGSTELEPLDVGSGKLISYLRSFGFQEVHKTDAAIDDGEGPKMLAHSKSLVDCCLPAAWHAQLPPQKASSDSLPRPTRSRSATASLRAPQAPCFNNCLELS